MRKLLFVLTLMALLGISCADAALPPTKFHVTYNGNEVKDNTFYAAVLECYSSDVLSSAENYTQLQHPSLLIKEYNASGNCTWYPEIPGMEISCSNSICEFYPRSNVFRFAVYIPSINRTFVSGVEGAGFGDFLFNISSSGGVQVSQTPKPSITINQLQASDVAVLALSFILTVAVELAASYIYLRLRKLSYGVLWSVLLANIISVPLFWLFLWVVGSSEFMICLLVFAGEFAVFVVEALIIFLLNRRRISIADAFLMSFINNVASFLAGIALLVTAGIAAGW